MLRPDQVPNQTEFDAKEQNDIEAYIDLMLTITAEVEGRRWVPQSPMAYQARNYAAVLDKYRDHWDITEGAGGWKFAPKTDLCPAK